MIFTTSSTNLYKKEPSISNFLPHLYALLSSLRNTYPLPSLEKVAPSEIANVILLIWSAIILKSLLFKYGLFDSFEIESIIGVNKSVS